MRAARRFLACAALAPVAVLAQPGESPTADALAGDWILTLTTADAVHRGLLELERSPDGPVAYVDGGPVPIEIDDATLRLQIDTRDGGGRLLGYELTGSLRDGALAGTLRPPLDAPDGTWRAERPEPRPPRPPRPVDFSGIWSRTSSGIAKVHLDYTPAGEERVADYHYLDDPALRCVSPGLVRVSGWPYPLEIVQTEAQLTILYESFHEVRRIHLDGRDFPTALPHRAMGYSIGRWDGSTLVVETRQLSRNFVDLHGQPLSEQARVVERMWLEDDGERMHSEMTIHDPENYERPIVRHRQWRLTPDTVILEYDCDPYPFFRGLELEGMLDTYWERMRRRQ